MLVGELEPLVVAMVFAIVLRVVVVLWVVSVSAVVGVLTVDFDHWMMMKIVKMMMKIVKMMMKIVKMMEDSEDDDRGRSSKEPR